MQESTLLFLIPPANSSKAFHVNGVNSMTEERPVLDKTLNSKTFQKFYYTKKELLDFCRENQIPEKHMVMRFLPIISSWMKKERGVLQLISSLSIIPIFVISLQIIKA